MSKQLTVKGRVQNKHNTEAEWLKSVYVDGNAGGTLLDNPFIPLDGELIVYDPDSVYNYKRFKFGDGRNHVDALPFIGMEYWDELQKKVPFLFVSTEPGTQMLPIIEQVEAFGCWCVVSFNGYYTANIGMTADYNGGTHYSVSGVDLSTFQVLPKATRNWNNVTVNDFNNLLLAIQMSYDTSLETKDKTIVGAINEINTELNKKFEVEVDSTQNLIKFIRQGE